MPFKSQAQRAWMYSQKPEMARRWEKHTRKGKKLPKRVTTNVRHSGLDPTRSITLRRSFQTAMSKRFTLLKKRIKELIIDQDALGLKESPVWNTRWKYQTSMQKLQAFRLWLQDQMKSIVTSENEWWQTYIEDGYRKGAKRALDDVTKGLPDLNKPIGPWYQGTKQDFLSGSFGRVVPVEKVKLIASRTFSDLDGVTDFMETNIVRALTDGLTQGQHPNQIASEMVETVSIGFNRARAIAHTEIIRAHATGQLDALEKLGVDQVGVTVEWSTAGDNHVCKACRPLENVVLTIKEAQGLIPRHVFCRCSWKPAGMIDRRGEQIKSKNQIEAALAKSLDAERPKTKRSMGRSGKLRQWVGAKIRVAKTRPKTLIG